MYIRKIEITNQIHGLLLENYGLTPKSFKKEEKASFSQHKSNLQKTLVKTWDNLTIKDHIEYL